jgi:hypothetical protein
VLLPPRLAWAIISVVTLVWVINFGLQFVVHDYHPDAAIDGVFLTVVGGAIALGRKGKPKDDDEDDEDEDDDEGRDPFRPLRDIRDSLERDTRPPRRHAHRAPPLRDRDRAPPRRRPRYHDDQPDDEEARYPESDHR